MIGTKTELTLLVVGYLLFKHMVADFPLQTRYQFSNKGRYGHPGGILHAGIHAIATLPVFLIVPQPATVIAAIAAAEFLIHYHIDYTKERIVHHFHWTAENNQFWWMLGVDQLLHNFTYLGIAAFAMR